MNEFIQSLTPKERAILFQALQGYSYDATMLLASANNPPSNLKPLMWLSKETDALKKKLFSDCFPEDLEPLDYFLKEQKEQKEQQQSPTT